MVRDLAPEDFTQVEFWTVGRKALDRAALCLPEELLLCTVITGVNRRIIHHNHRRTFTLLAEKVEAVDYRLGIKGTFKGKRRKFLVQVQKAQKVLARAVGGRQRQGLSHFLPGIWETRSAREPRFVEIPASTLPSRLPSLRPEGGQF